MNRMNPRHVLVALLALLTVPAGVRAGDELRLPVSVYRDRMKAGWIGQIAGVAWGAPTEFKFPDKIIPEASVPKWKPGMINNAFGQDDLYVEMTFLRTLEEYGFDVSIRQAGIDFANSKYGLACANNAGRNNLRNGIAPPDSSHPKFSRRPNDIDYQIEADYSGLIAPGLPNTAIALGEKFGRLMNYGDGVYGGQFMGGMYAAAFFETDRIKIIEAGLRCIPEKSQYAEMVRDLLRWYRENPSDWQKTWGLIHKKYREDPEYQKASNGGIDVKINGAYVLLGLLYGEGDLDKTIVISCRGGQDSDCNPSSSAGVLFTSVGFAKLPERFTKELDEKTKFSFTAYNIPGLMEVCEKLARQAVVRAGGRIEKEGEEEVFVIPVQAPKPSPLELSWDPGPIANSRFTQEELAQITILSLLNEFKKFAPGWEMRNCGDDLDPGPQPEFRGQKNVFLTHPLDQNTGCTLTTSATIPTTGKTVLKLLVSNHPEGDWLLVVKADREELLRKTIDTQATQNGWLPVEVDLSKFAGKTIKLDAINHANGWSFEAAYWAEVAIRTE